MRSLGGGRRGTNREAETWTLFLEETGGIDSNYQKEVEGRITTS